jgi:hypothetical protein
VHTRGTTLEQRRFTELPQYCTVQYAYWHQMPTICRELITQPRKQPSYQVKKKGVVTFCKQ